MKRLAYLFARLPLPMLALAASYGVYQYNLLFTPAWVALVSAAAFELTYVALAFTPTDDTRRATYVSIAAVVVSVLYNVLAALFVRRPEMLIGTPWYGDVLLAALHGAPLAIMAYNVAALLLHSQRSATLSTLLSELPPTPHQAQQVTVNVLSDSGVTLSKSERVKRLALSAGVSETTMWRRVKVQPELLEGVE
jgi:hypothetical protein